MQLVDINQLRPGQVVASAVTGAGGVVLCPLGIQLTDITIGRLRAAGIRSVMIADAEAGDTKLIDERLAKLEARFEGIDDPILLQLKATMAHRLNCMKLA